MSDSITTAEEARGAIRQWVADYSRRRIHRAVGEFIDEEGAANPQFGIGGTCFIASIEDFETFPAKFHPLWAAINAGLRQNPGNRDDLSRPILKDVPRVPGKAILLALGPKAELDCTDAVRQIFAHRGPDQLVKPVTDDPRPEGDPIVTSLVNLMLRFGGRDGDFMTEIHSTLPELGRLLAQGGLTLMERLLVSTTLCVFSFADAIVAHRRLLDELYSSDEDWHRAFSSNSPFLDHRYSDTADNRYLRIPTSFIVMSAIYVTIGDEARFFSFPPIRTMIQEIRVPFSAHVGRDKNKASAYFAWFSYVALHPARFLRTPRQSSPRVMLARLGYRARNLTALGMVVVLVCVVGTAGVAWYAYQTYLLGIASQGDKFLGAVGTALGAFLGLFKTRKR
jgi:hypothetical protein